MNSSKQQAHFKTWIQSARTRIVLASAVSIGLLIIAFGVFVHFAVAQTLISSVDSELQDRIRPDLHRPPPPPRPFGGLGFGGQGFGPDRGNGPPNGFGNPPPFLSNNTGPEQGQSPTPGQAQPPAPHEAASTFRPRIFNLDGTAISAPGPGGRFQPAEAPWNKDNLKQAKTTNGPIFSTISDPIYLRLITQRVVEGNEAGDIVQCAYPLAEIMRAQAGVDRALILLVPIAVIVALIGGIASTSGVFKRVGELAAVAQSMNAENLSAKLPVSGNDEFASLALSFNGLLARLKESFDAQKRLIEQQRRFTADASHELKTPLTIIRGTTSLALSSMSSAELGHEEIEDIDRAAESMSRLVNDLLILAKYDEGKSSARNRISILSAVNNAFADVSSLARNRCCTKEMETDAVVLGDENELVKVFVNLIENASKAIGDGEGVIKVSTTVDGGFAGVNISDNGIGIDPAHGPNLFDRFYRIDSARSQSGTKAGGTGLGLAISKSVVESMGGSISICSDGIGKGAVVNVKLPVV